VKARGPGDARALAGRSRPGGHRFSTPSPHKIADGDLWHRGNLRSVGSPAAQGAGVSVPSEQPRSGLPPLPRAEQNATGPPSEGFHACALYPDPPLGEAELAVELLEEAESDQSVDVITSGKIEYVDPVIRYDEPER